MGRGDGGYFLFLNRMTSDKGAHRAAAFARETGINLVLAGKKREPAEHAYFNEHVEPLLGSNVEYVGEVDADEKLALLGSATALLNPIQWPEPFGLVMIEAMACGTPVVATACGAAPEIVRDGTTGLLVRRRTRDGSSPRGTGGARSPRLPHDGRAALLDRAHGARLRRAVRTRRPTRRRGLSGAARPLAGQAERR